MFRLIYFPLNSAWAFVFGDDLQTAEIVDLELENGRCFFPDRADAVAAASRHGLNVERDGFVQAA